MADTRGQPMPFDQKAVMTSALAVPFPKLNPDPPEEREQRLQAILGGLDEYDAAVRNNIVDISKAALQGDKTKGAPNAHYDSLFDSLGARHDRTAGDIYVFRPDAPVAPAQPNGATQDPRVEAMLSDYNAHAQERNKVYQDALKREQEKNGTLPGARSGPTGDGVPAQTAGGLQRTNSVGSRTVIDRARDPRSRG